jgi:hypothetical protein
MHKMMNKKFYLGPRFGTLFNKKWIKNSELLQCYHQIPLFQSDQIKTSFITPYGADCYVTMPLGLKNAGATYQRTMQRCLQGQIGRNMHAYVDNVVVKTKQSGMLLDDLKETFATYGAIA